MTRIDAVEIRQVDLQPKVKRTDAIQSFVVQETDSDHCAATGCTGAPGLTLT